MFGTKIPLQWKTYAFRGRTRNSATFEIDNEKYNLTTDLYSIILPSQQNKSLEAIEVSFRRILETGVPTVTQTAPKHPAKVFGIIYNEIQEAITTQAPDIIFFSAKYINDGGNLVIFKKRLRIYQELYDRILQHGYPGLPEPIENKNGVHFVLFNSNLKITKQDIAWIKNNI